MLLLSMFQLKKNEMKETNSKSEITNKKYARTFNLFFENTLVLRLLNDFFIFFTNQKYQYIVFFFALLRDCIIITMLII